MNKRELMELCGMLSAEDLDTLVLMRLDGEIEELERKLSGLRSQRERMAVAMDAGSGDPEPVAAEERPAKQPAKRGRAAKAARQGGSQKEKPGADPALVEAMVKILKKDGPLPACDVLEKLELTGFHLSQYQHPSSKVGMTLSKNKAFKSCADGYKAA